MKMHQPHVRYTAESYDQYTARFVKPFDDMLAKQVLDEVLPGPDGRVVLDIGTGTARFLVRLAGLDELKGWRLIGTDVFADMIERANQTIADEGFEGRIELLEQDVHAMDLPDGFADIVISRSTLHHWERPVQALAEIDRVLKPGGVAIIHDVRRDPAPEAIAEFNRMRTEAGLPPSFLDEKFTAAEVEGFLAEAGLAEHSRVLAPKSGLGALGMAVEIAKPPDAGLRTQPKSGTYD